MEKPQKKNNNLLLVLSSLLFVASLIFFISQKKDKTPAPIVKNPPSFSAQIIPVTDGFGYQIFADTSIIIKQETIPGREGTKGFATEQLAKKTADLVIHKLNNGIFPPGISEEELSQLGVE